MCGRLLEGVRVIDLSHYIPGPMATLFLSDMGAEVLKIEPPSGDGMRVLGPRDDAGRPVFYRALNAGKAELTLNLKDDSDRATFLQLVKGADAVVEGFRPGVLARLKIDYQALKAVNPGIILCSISGYGVSSSRSHEAGHDANYLALTGVLHRNGSDAPIYFDPPVSDVGAALFAAMAILGALYRKQRTGEGCVIDMGIADTVMPMQMMQIADYGANGTVPQRGETYLNGAAAYYQIYRTKDGQHAVLGAMEPKFWSAFCQAAERPDLLDRQSEPLPQTALGDDLADLFASMTAAEADARFGGADCCFTLVNDLGAALGERHIADRALIRRNSLGDLEALFPAWINGVPPGERGKRSIEGSESWIAAAMRDGIGVASARPDEATGKGKHVA